MPRVPITPEMTSAFKRAQSSMDSRSMSPAQQEGPTPFQKASASRVKSLFKEGRSQPRYMDQMLGPRTSSGESTWELKSLNQALALAYEVDRANGIEHSKYAEAQRAAWRQALAK